MRTRQYIKTRVDRNQTIAIVFRFFRELGIDVSKLLEEGKYNNEREQAVYLSFNKGVKRNETTSQHSQEKMYTHMQKKPEH